jgi:hypothetical protein
VKIEIAGNGVQIFNVIHVMTCTPAIEYLPQLKSLLRPPQPSLELFFADAYFALVLLEILITKVVAHDDQQRPQVWFGTREQTVEGMIPSFADVVGTTLFVAAACVQVPVGNWVSRCFATCTETDAEIINYKLYFEHKIHSSFPTFKVL